MRTMPKNLRRSTTGAAPAPLARPAARTAPARGSAAAGTAGRGWPGAALLDDPRLARVLLAVWSADPAVILRACPGGGKTRAVSLLAAALAHRGGLRVAVAAQTRGQAAELAQRIAGVSDRVSLITSGRGAVSAAALGVPTVTGRSARWARPGGGEILVGTAARWLYMDPERVAADVLAVDEAWQCTYGDLGALGALARQVVLVGDPGQIAPVVTGSTVRWDGQATGPHRSAPDALLAAHGDAMTEVPLTNSWRLGAQTCALLSEHFYPGMPFGSRRPDEALVTDTGAVLPEMTALSVPVQYGPTDPGLLDAVAQRVRELVGHNYRVGGSGAVPMSGSDVAVVVPHVAQAGALRALLADVPGLLIGTANSVQGLERPAVVAVHPLAGYREAEPFALDPGRLCVTLSRHRAHLSVLCDPHTERVLTGDAPEVVTARKVLDALAPA